MKRTSGTGAAVLRKSEAIEKGGLEWALLPKLELADEPEYV